MLNKIKKWFLEKPKKNFWSSAFVTLFLIRYVLPPTFIFMTFLMLGATQPDLPIESVRPIMINTSNTLSKVFVNSFEVMFTTGQGIARNNRLSGQFISVSYNAFVYIMYFSIIALFLNLIRYGTAGIYKKFKRKKGSKR